MAFINGFPTEDDIKIALYLFEPEQISDLVLSEVPTALAYFLLKLSFNDVYSEEIDNFINFPFWYYDYFYHRRWEDIEFASMRHTYRALYQRYNPYNLPFADRYSYKIFRFYEKYSTHSYIGASNGQDNYIKLGDNITKFELNPISDFHNYHFQELEISLPNNSFRLDLSYYYPEYIENIEEYKIARDLSPYYGYYDMILNRENKVQHRRIANDCIRVPLSRRFQLQFDTYFAHEQKITIRDDILIASLILDFSGDWTQEDIDFVLEQIPHYYHYEYLDIFLSEIDSEIEKQVPEINDIRIATELIQEYSLDYTFINKETGADNNAQAGLLSNTSLLDAERNIKANFTSFIPLPDYFKFASFIKANNNNWNYEKDSSDIEDINLDNIILHKVIGSNEVRIGYDGSNYLYLPANHEVIKTGWAKAGSLLPDELDHELISYQEFTKNIVNTRYASFYNYHNIYPANPNDYVDTDDDYLYKKEIFLAYKESLFFGKLRSIFNRFTQEHNKFWDGEIYGSEYEEVIIATHGRPQNYYPGFFLRHNYSNVEGTVFNAGIKRFFSNIKNAVGFASEIGCAHIGFDNRDGSDDEPNWYPLGKRHYKRIYTQSFDINLDGDNLTLINHEFDDDFQIIQDKLSNHVDDYKYIFFRPFNKIGWQLNKPGGLYTYGERKFFYSGVDVDINLQESFVKTVTTTFDISSELKRGLLFQTDEFISNFINEAHLNCYMNGCDLEDIKKQIREIHMSLEAGTYAYKQGSEDTSRWWNLGKMVEAIATVLGLSFNSDGSIRSIRQGKLVAQGDSIPAGWNFGQFGRNSGGDSTGQTGGLPNERRYGIAYELRTNTFGNDDFTGETNKINQGGVVLAENLPQLIHFIVQDFDRGLGLQDMGANVLPTPNGKIASYQGLNQMILDLLYTIGQISRQTAGTHILSLQNQAVLQELLGSLGLPITVKELDLSSSEDEPSKLPYPGLAPDSPTLNDLNGLVLLNLAALIGSKIQPIDTLEDVQESNEIGN